MNTDARKLNRMVSAVMPPNCCSGGMVAKVSMPNPVTVVMVVPKSAVPVWPTVLFMASSILSNLFMSSRNLEVM